MPIYCYASAGFEGNLVEVEVDIRRGIPGLEIVGLPDSAVKEARDRVRVAVRNAGFAFPRDRVLINLSPADVRKEGSGFDLPIALAILIESGELPQLADGMLAIGELQLSGRVRSVRGILSAVAAGMRSGISKFLVPEENLREARALDYGHICGASSLACAAEALATGIKKSGYRDDSDLYQSDGSEREDTGRQLTNDFAEIRGHTMLKRVLAIAAAGGHHTLLFGPPGSGKTLAARRLPGILPDLSREESIEVTRIHSLAGLLGNNEGLIRVPPVRSPHHSATAEGVIGGGRTIKPGEISLAHHGVLILDEVPEFRRNLLQSLREPLESGRVDIARAGSTSWYPARFQLLLTANPCPCGNLGRDDAACICTRFEIERYWKKLGGALLDRIDLRIPVKPVGPAELLGAQTASSADLLELVTRAREAQERRIDEGIEGLNSRLTPAEISICCGLDPGTERDFEHAVRSVSMSSRATHSILKVARTIADMEDAGRIEIAHLYEAVQLRRYGEGDFFWS